MNTLGSLGHIVNDLLTKIGRKSVVLGVVKKGPIGDEFLVLADI